MGRAIVQPVYYFGRYGSPIRRQKRCAAVLGMADSPDSQRAQVRTDTCTNLAAFAIESPRFLRI